jgi:dTDP-4-amino-4,6-dideoxygalactose transaminase
MIPLMETNGQQTNFGPWFWKVVAELHGNYGKHWLPVSTGTSAIQIAAQIQFRRGQRIAVPDFTMVATLHAVVAAGCVPVICDCDPDTGIIKPDTLSRLARERAIDGAVVVSPFGAKVDAADFDVLGLPLVYDLAGAWPKQLVTNYPVTYSCHATKNISTREGGLIAFATELQWEKARRLSCFDLGPERHPTTIYAGNHKMDEYRCAQLFLQLTEQQCELASRMHRKRRLVADYAVELPWAIPLKTLAIGCPSLCVLRVPDAADLETAGAAAGITFKRYYYPLLSDIVFDEVVETICQPDPLLRQYLAFPSDVGEPQFMQVVNFAKGIGNSRGWRTGS